MLFRSTLVLVSEQGLGDTLQFMRYAPLLRRQAGAVRFCAPSKLHGLLRSSGLDPDPLAPDQVAELNDGLWLPLLSLPDILGVSPEQPLHDGPYITVPTTTSLRWADILGPETRPIIGLHWQGNPDQETNNSRGRSFPLETFAPLAELPGVSLDRKSTRLNSSHSSVSRMPSSA